jgi:hypothetical protein
MALGFEQRDPHQVPAPNEHYTKLYVFQITEGDKATKGSYQWGQNEALFENIYKLRYLYEKIGKEIEGTSIKWIIAPDLTGQSTVIAWTYTDAPRYVCIANLSCDKATQQIHLQSTTNTNAPTLLYDSTHSPAIQIALTSEGYAINTIEPTGCLILCTDELS